VNALSVRPGIMDITPYVGGESALSGRDRVIKLSSNEGALGASPKAAAAYEAASAELHRYPDADCLDLRRAIAKRHGLDWTRIVCGAGSDELIGLLCRAYAGPGDEVLHSEHGFLMYPIAAKAVGATPVAAPETGLKADIGALIQGVTGATRLLFLANPNNPTGTYLSATELRRLRDELPGDVLLVIDAAYAEYVTYEDYSAGADLVESGANVVMTRTFSKIHALGGARLGWAYCPTAVADVLNRVRSPFNVGSPAQAAGLAAIEDTDFTKRALDHNETWRPWLAVRLRELGLDVPSVAGNFVLARFPANSAHGADAADRYLKDLGIIVRRVAAYGLPEYLRITVGVEEEMRAVTDALAEFLK
jgi:histidinol-phosphate aminotransferase